MQLVTRSFDVCSTSTDSVMPTMNPEDSCDETAPIGKTETELLYVQATYLWCFFVHVQQVQWSTSSCHNLFLVSVQPCSLSLGSRIWTTMSSESKLQCSLVNCTLYPDYFGNEPPRFSIGLMSSLRLIGPVFGYGLAAICMRLYVNLSETTTLKPRDPSWIGAWWLGKLIGIFLLNLLEIYICFRIFSQGFMIIGIIQISTAWLLACYPRRLPKKSTTAVGFMTIAAQKSTQHSQQPNKPKERTFKRILFVL